MSQNQIILFLETPRSGGEKGHRWLAPQSSHPITESTITGWSAKLEGADPDGQILCARRKVGQVVQGNTRDAWEMLVAANLPSLDLTERERITKALEQFLDTFDPSRVDWEGNSGLVISVPDLDYLYSTLQSLPSASEQQSPDTPLLGMQTGESQPRKKRKMKKIVIGVVAVFFILWAIVTIIPDGKDDSGRLENDPIWNSFITLRDKSFRSAESESRSASDDAKYLWENVTVSKWKRGDFLRTDLTRNSPEATHFLELDTPETWYLADAFDRSEDATELRAILPVARTPSNQKSEPFRRDFVEALAYSSKQLIEADLSTLDPVAAEFLDRQRAKLQGIPDNDRLDWPTPADGRRATLLFETISELSRTAPPERRIRTWDDLFSDDITNATIVAAERTLDPVASFQWNLMKPIVTWASSAQ